MSHIINQKVKRSNKRSGPTIITISGLDGSGKSTQLHILQEHLESTHQKVFPFHAATFSIAQTLLKKKKTSSESTPPTQKDTAVTKASWLQIQLRKVALFIDIFRFKMLCKKLQKDGYDVIVSDRYFYDSVINILYLSRTKDTNIILKYITTLIPIPDVKLFLTVPPTKIMQRTEAPEQGLDYLEKKNALYHDYVSTWDYTMIDGDRDKEIIFEEIKKSV